jgi:hypothetical protein
LHGGLTRTSRLGAASGGTQRSEQAHRDGSGPEGDVRGSSHPFHNVARIIGIALDESSRH